MPRQQRSRVSRRAVHRGNPWPTPDMPLTIETINGDLVTFNVTTGANPLQYTGTLPPIKIAGASPIAFAATSPTAFTLQYPAPIAVSSYAILAERNNDVTNKYGGWLAPYRFFIPTNPFPPAVAPTEDWTASTIVANQITVTCVNSPPTGAVHLQTMFRNETLSEDSTAIVPAGTGFLVTFPSNVTAGDIISFPVDNYELWCGDGKLLLGTQHACTP